MCTCVSQVDENVGVKSDNQSPFTLLERNRYPTYDCHSTAVRAINAPALRNTRPSAAAAAAMTAVLVPLLMTIFASSRRPQANRHKNAARPEALRAFNDLAQSVQSTRVLYDEAGAPTEGAAAARRRQREHQQDRQKSNSSKKNNIKNRLGVGGRKSPFVAMQRKAS